MRNGDYWQWRNLLHDAMVFLDEHEAHPEPMHWLCGDNDDEGESYCYNCIEAIRPNAVLGEDYTYDGCSNMEEDGSEVCSRCGKLLSYTLTDYGVNSELDHFTEAGFSWDNAETCYELARIAHGVWTNEQFRRLHEILKHGKNQPLNLNL